MSDEDAAEFRADLGIKEPGLDRMIRLSYELTGLISFFTVGADECRAWNVARRLDRARRRRARSTPIWSAGSSAPRSCTGTTCWPPGRWPRRENAASCGRKARRTSSQDGDCLNILFNV